VRPCPKPECKRERSGLDDDDDDDDASPVKGFEEKKEADAGAVPGRVAVVGLPSASEPGKGNKWVPVPAVGDIADVVVVVVDEDVEEDNFDWSMGEGTAERGGSDRGCWESGPDEVGGLEEGLEAKSTAMKQPYKPF
jgi:hypothetical protein